MNRRILGDCHRIGWLALCVITLAWSQRPAIAWAEPACGSLSLQAGLIKTGKALTADWVASDSGKRCMSEIYWIK